MRRLKLFLILSILGFGTLLVSAPASATIITNATTTLFSDDFEGGVVNAAPTGGSPGSWAVTNALVWDAVAPGPSEGTKYLQVARPTGGSASAQANFATQSVGSVVHMETMLNIGETSTAAGSAAGQILGGAWPINIVAGLNGCGHSVLAYSVSGWIDTGLSYEVDTWQKWQIDWTVGDSTFALAVDEATAPSVAVDTSGGYVTLSSFWFGSGEGSTIYIDAVPEPSAFVSLTLGLFGLLAYAWRKRK